MKHLGFGSVAKLRDNIIWLYAFCGMPNKPEVLKRQRELLPLMSVSSSFGEVSAPVLLVFLLGLDGLYCYFLDLVRLLRRITSLDYWWCDLLLFDSSPQPAPKGGGRRLQLLDQAAAQLGETPPAPTATINMYKSVLKTYKM